MTPAAAPVTTAAALLAARRARTLGAAERVRAEPAGFAVPSHLVRRARDGDSGAKAELCLLCVAPLERYFKRALRSSDAAEDATQHVFIRMLEALPTYVESAPFAAWLFVIARNYLIDRARSRARTDPVAPSVLSRYQDRRQVQPELSNVEHRDSMRTLIAPLPLDQQRVLCLIYNCGLSV